MFHMDLRIGHYKKEDERRSSALECVEGFKILAVGKNIKRGGASKSKRAE